MDKKNLYIFKDGNYHDVNSGFAVVEINNTSGTLSDEDFALVQNDNTIIQYGSTMLYKWNIAGDPEIYYRSAPSRDNQGVSCYQASIDLTEKTYRVTEVQLGIVQELLGTATLYGDGETGNIRVTFTNIDTTKIGTRTLLIFTYGNCFVLTPLSQSGESRVAGNLVYDSNGNSKLSRLKFNYVPGNHEVDVVTDCTTSFSTGQFPTAYLFAFNY